jgi:hypothetical protein
MTIVATSSRTYLGPQQSGAVTSHPIEETALEVTRLFEVRGFALVDQHVDAPNGELLLKYTKTTRPIAAQNDGVYLGSRDIGSVFYVWVAPAASGSTVNLLGKPTLDGTEPCTNDGVVLACNKVELDADFASTFMSGRTEADVAHGVLSQLALEGYAVAALPVNAPALTSDPEAVQQVLACKAQKHDMLLKAVATKDPDEKRSILDRLPGC